MTRAKASISFAIKINDKHIRKIIEIAEAGTEHVSLREKDQINIPSGMSMADAIISDYMIKVKWDELNNAGVRCMMRRDLINAIKDYIETPDIYGNILKYEYDCMKIDMEQINPNIVDEIIRRALFD